MKLELKIENTLNLEDIFDTNQKAWNKKVEYDVLSKYYDIEEFKTKKNSLYPLDIKILNNIEGKRILHLQSYLGLDSISMSKMGAKLTAVDFCGNAINFSKFLSEEMNEKVDFISSNIYNLDSIILEPFDVIYMSYGAICWLPDIKVLVEKTKNLLKKGGEFIIIDFHPLVISFDLFRDDKIKYSYFNNPEENIIEINRKGTYADVNAPIETVEYNWNHSISEILNAFIINQFLISDFNEYPFLPMNGFPNLTLGKDGYYHVENSEDKYPLLFSLKATKI